MGSRSEIIRGDTQTISIPVTNLFPTTIGGYAGLFVVPLTSTPPDVFLDPTAVITKQLGPFATNVTSFDFVLSNTDSLVPLGEYDWYARFKDASNNLTSIQLNPRTVEVVPPKGEDC